MQVQRIIVVLTLLIISDLIQYSQQQIPTTACTPYSCNITHVEMDDPKSDYGNNTVFKIGLVLSLSRTSTNTTTLSRLRAYQFNHDLNFLPNHSIEIYSRTASGAVNMGSAAIALLQLAGVDALIVDGDDDSTQYVAQIASSFGVSVIALSSTTEQFRNKTLVPNLLRMSTPNQYQILAAIKILQHLHKNNTFFIYSSDVYGNTLASNMISQAKANGITVTAIGIPATITGNINVDPYLKDLKKLVKDNWNVFITAVNQNQATRVLTFFNTSGFIGEDYLHILGPTVEKAYSSTSAIAPLMDGALALVPTQILSQNGVYSLLHEDWATLNSSSFSGTIPSYGFLAYDAVSALVHALDETYTERPNFTFPSSLFLSKVREIDFQGVSGHVYFDDFGDRIGDYTVFNHIGRGEKEIGVFIEDQDSTFQLFDNITFFNGSTTIPNLVIPINYTYYCSYSSSSSSSDSSLGPAVDDENNSTSSGETSNSTNVPTITGYIDPFNSSRCICEPGFGGDRCNVIVPILSYQKYIPSISIALGIITTIATLITVFAAVMLILYWEAFRKHGSFYSAVIIAGVFFGLSSVYVLLPVPSDALCMLFPWLLGIGFTLVYGCLFIKTWTLYRVVRDAAQLKKTSLTPAYIIKGIGIYLAFEVILLTIWTAVQRPTVEYRKMLDNTYILQCTGPPTFWAIFAGTKAVWLVFGAVLSVLTRNVSDDYSQSKNIAYATYNIVALLVIAIPISVTIKDVPGGVMIVEAGVIVAAFTFTLCCLFFGIWFSIFLPDKALMPSISPRQSSDTQGPPKNSSSANSQHSQNSQNSPSSYPSSSSSSSYLPPTHSKSVVEMVVRI